MKKRIYGYCRVSTLKQSIARQIRNIKAEYPDAVIVTDEYTGTSLDRPGWTKLYKKLKSGDTVIFDQVSRMSRDADEGFRVYEDLYNKGVNLIFLKERHIDTDTYKKAMETGVPMTGTNVDFILEGVNKYLLSLAKEQIRLAFDQAEKEVEDLHQRTREGIETARLNGKQIGQPKGAKLTTKKSIAAKEIILKHSKDFNGDLTDDEVRKLCGIARGTYYKYKRELKSERTPAATTDRKRTWYQKYIGYEFNDNGRAVVLTDVFYFEDEGKVTGTGYEIKDSKTGETQVLDYTAFKAIVDQTNLPKN